MQKITFYKISAAVLLAIIFLSQSEGSGNGVISNPFKINADTPVKKKNKEPEFEYPYGMVADTAKKRFVKEYNKGKILYNQTCAKCHNMLVNSKQVIPDFSLPQLMDYEIRIQYQAHEEDLKETNITHDELDFIVSFLRYKKKSGVPYQYKAPSN